MMAKLTEMREKLISKKKDNKGFTLVELIVVIVILAILIGVTIGGVYGYVNKSRINTDINNASAIASTLQVITTNSTISTTGTGAWTELSANGAAIAAPVTASTFGMTFTAKNAGDADPVTDMFPDGIPATKTTGVSFYYKVKPVSASNSSVGLITVVASKGDPGTAGNILTAQE